MTIHIFNPDHDLALASGLANFTAPHAGRQLRHDLGWLPALWAADGDVVLTDDARLALRATARRRVATRCFADRRSPGPEVLAAADAIAPWGWNAALRAQLLRLGLPARLMPTEEQTEAIRRLSHRRLTASLLPLLQADGTTGQAVECARPQEVDALVDRLRRAVVKAPWSSSGRGVRFLSADAPLSTTAGWLRNTIARQGSVMVEPYYNKVKDFGMEFQAHADGRVTYAGLSLFVTQNGAYTGNLVATEAAKAGVLARYLPASLLAATRDALCRHLSAALGGGYVGPLGVDMMVVRLDGRLLLHPCVEVNLRRTMGHVALELDRRLNGQADDELRHSMRIVYENHNYKLRIKRL